MLKEARFRGRTSGDCECFCWDGVPIEHTKVLSRTYEFDSEFGEDLTRLYPNDIFEYLGCKDDEMYEFIITARRIK